jgi:hypothetical protein
VEKSGRLGKSLFQGKYNTSQLGNSRIKTIYNFLDANPVAGENFYRIRSIEINGTSQYSRIEKVKMGSAVPAISIHPNPIVDGRINMEFKNCRAGTYNIRLLNSIGRSY